jgi:hypothetical protein
MFYHGMVKDRFPEELIRLNPECRKGWAKEMLEVVKNIDIHNNGTADLFSGPEYIRKSDAELHFRPPECP